MELDKDFVRAKRPCASGFRWFARNRPAGSDYQQHLDALVAAGRVSDACWLLEQFGPVDIVLELDSIDAEAIVFAGTIRVRGGIDVDTVVHAGRSIEAGGGIRAGGELRAGEDVRAGGQVRCAGRVQAGGRIRVGWGVEVGGDLVCADDLRVDWGVA